MAAMAESQHATQGKHEEVPLVDAAQETKAYRHVQFCAILGQWNKAQLCTCPRSKHVPWHQVAVMLCY